MVARSWNLGSFVSRFVLLTVAPVGDTPALHTNLSVCKYKEDIYKTLNKAGFYWLTLHVDGKHKHNIKTAFAANMHKRQTFVFGKCFIRSSHFCTFNHKYVFLVYLFLSISREKENIALKQEMKNHEAERTEKQPRRLLPAQRSGEQLFPPDVYRLFKEHP